jgi:hypothetical protein
MFYQVRIAPAQGVAGRWDVWRDPVAWADDLDLLQALYTHPAYEEVCDLAEDALPAYAEDIRGRVFHEPSRILVLVCTKHGMPVVRYVGIVSDDG